MTPAAKKVILRRFVPVPTITSSASPSVAENAPLSHSLTANQTVTWSLVGGADLAKFEINGASTLRFASNVTKDFEAPDDADTNNTYVVTVRAMNASGKTTDQTITTTVTDVVEGSWSDTFTQTLNLDSGGWNGTNGRMHLPASLISTSGSKIRLTLEAASAENMKIVAAYIGHYAGSGDAYDFDGTQIPVLVSGSGAFIVTAGGTVLTDELTYALDETKALVFSWYCDDAAQDGLRGANGVTGASSYFKAGASEVSVSDVSGMTQVSDRVSFINKIEAFA